MTAREIYDELTTSKLPFKDVIAWAAAEMHRSGVTPAQMIEAWLQRLNELKPNEAPEVR